VTEQPRISVCCCKKKSNCK